MIRCEAPCSAGSAAPRMRRYSWLAWATGKTQHGSPGVVARRVVQLLAQALDDRRQLIAPDVEIEEREAIIAHHHEIARIVIDQVAQQRFVRSEQRLRRRKRERFRAQVIPCNRERAARSACPAARSAGPRPQALRARALPLPDARPDPATSTSVLSRPCQRSSRSSRKFAIFASPSSLRPNRAVMRDTAPVSCRLRASCMISNACATVAGEARDAEAPSRLICIARLERYRRRGGAAGTGAG